MAAQDVTNQDMAVQDIATGDTLPQGMSNQEQTEQRINAFFRDTFDTDVLYRDIERKDYYFLYCIRECAKQRPEDEGRVYLFTLVETMNLTMPEVSKAVERLESEGFVQWETDTRIGRTYVTLTENALDRISREFERLRNCYEKIVAEIDADELKQMLQSMKKIRDIMRQEL